MASSFGPRAHRLQGSFSAVMVALPRSAATNTRSFSTKQHIWVDVPSPLPEQHRIAVRLRTTC